MALEIQGRGPGGATDAARPIAASSAFIARAVRKPQRPSMAPGEWPSLSSPLWIKQKVSRVSVFVGLLLSPVAGHEKPALRAGAEWIDLVGWSVCAAAMEGLKHQIAHRTYVGLDAFQPIGIVVAILCPLAIGSVALGLKFPVEPGQHGVVREGLARDVRQRRNRAADQRRNCGGHVPSPLVSCRLAEQPVSLVGKPARLKATTGLAQCLATLPIILPSTVAKVDYMAMMRLFTREDPGLAVLPLIAIKDDSEQGVLIEVDRSQGISETFYAATLARRFPKILQGLINPVSLA